MNRTFRIASALLRQDWLMVKSHAEALEPLINAFLSKSLDSKNEEDEEVIPLVGFAISAAGSESPTLTQFSLDDPDLPEDSILVLPVKGAIMKEGSCFSAGTEDYVRMMRQAYANDKVIGTINLLDSPGGQLSGTPTLFDTVRDPAKPSITVVNEGIMGSAAYWGFCGSDYIYATQQTDQIGSIGVFVRLRDSTKAMADAGIIVREVYSSRSAQKNKPYKDAIAGDDTLLIKDLDYAADLFRAAVEKGRGDRLKNGKKGSEDDVFEGGVYYADKAIELGLIDGYGDLQTAIDKIVEINNARKASSPSASLTGRSASAELTTLATSDAPVTGDHTPTGQVIAADANSNPNLSENDMFGDKHKALTALAGQETVSDAQLTDINANLDELKITGARIISTAYLQEAQQSVAALATANDQIKTLTQERDELQTKAAQYGAQPGVLGSKSEKIDEKTAGNSQPENPFWCETDAEVARMRAEMK